MADAAGDDAARVTWCGWRRLANTDNAWERVPGAEAQTKAGAFNALMTLGELSAREGRWEYWILPAGQRPNLERYRDRMLRPGGH